MARFSRVYVAIALGVLGCEGLIGADFGDYRRAPSGGGGSSSGGEAGQSGGTDVRGGRGGNAGSGASDAGGGVSGSAGSATGGSATGGSATGGSATGGSATGGTGEPGGAAGEGPCPPPTGDGYRTSELIAGDNHTCAVIEGSGDLKCWGANSEGQLGLGHARSVGARECEPGQTPFVDLGTDRTVASLMQSTSPLALGAQHTCVVLDNYKVKCWGNNDSGQLGLGDIVTRGDDPGEMGEALPYVDLGANYKALAVAAGYSHTCAVLELTPETTELRCWGSNTSGESGSGDSEDRIGDTENEMAILEPVDLGSGRWVHATASYPVALGSGHTCAVLNLGGVKCWGNNFSGQLGLGTTASERGRAADMGDALFEVDLGGYSVSGVTAGFAHTCAYLTGGDMMCWGSNQYGQLGLGHTRNIGRDPSEMGQFLPLVRVSDNQDIRIGWIDAGYFHTCASLYLPGGGDPEDSTIKCWGLNEHGQLGLGDLDSRGGVADQMGGFLPTIPLLGPAVMATAGADHTCAFMDSHGAVCWGVNQEGQLGIGQPAAPVGDAPGEVEALGEIDLGSP